jgi:6-phosphogluconolactonase (cycloisomerase 2 family)
MMIRTSAWVALGAVAVAVSACESSSPNVPSDGGDASSGESSSGGARSSGGNTTNSGGTNNGNGGVTTNSGGTNNGNGGVTTNSGGTTNGSGGTTSSSGGITNGTGGITNGTGGTTSSSGGTANDGLDGGGAADGGGADGGRGGPREFAYIATRFGGILACSIDTASGKAVLLPGSPINRNGTANSIAVHSSQKFVYVVNEHAHIDTYRIGADGTLPAQPNSTTQNELVGLITLDPKGRFAFAAGDNALYTFKIDPTTGVLTGVGAPLIVGDPSNPTFPAFIAADPTGNFVYASAHGIWGYRVEQATGALTEVIGSPFGSTGLPDGDIMLGSAIAFKPSGDFLFSSGFGLNAFAVDGASGALTLVNGSPFSVEVESDPQAPNLTVDPQGKYLYASFFHSDTNHVPGFAIDPTNGKLQEVPGSPFTASAPYSLAVDPTGNFVYVATDFGQLQGYRVTRSTGRLDELVSVGSPFQFGGLEAKIAFATLP